MQRKELLKRSSIRYAEYYGMVEVQDALYKDSADGKIFTKLIEVISSFISVCKVTKRNHPTKYIAIFFVICRSKKHGFSFLENKKVQNSPKSIES